MKDDDFIYEIMSVKNKHLLPFLRLEPIFNTHSIYVCEKKPEDESLAVISKSTNRIEATLITGKPDLFLVQGYWLSASSWESVEAVMDKIEDEKNFFINYPIWAEEIIRQYFPKADYSYDNLYIFPHKELKTSIDSIKKATKLTYELYHKLSIPEDFKHLLLPQDLLPESKFYCIVVDNKLRAIGEHLLETNSTNAISQLFTLGEDRGRGYSTGIVYAITREILSNRKIPIGFFSEENISSKKVFEKVGFTLHLRLGYMECYI